MMLICFPVSLRVLQVVYLKKTFSVVLKGFLVCLFVYCGFVVLFYFEAKSHNIVLAGLEFAR